MNAPVTMADLARAVAALVAAGRQVQAAAAEVSQTQNGGGR